MKTRSKSKSSSKPQRAEYIMEESTLLHLMETELKEIYWAEKTLTKAIPKMIKKSTSEQLVEALDNHLEETENQVRKVERVFEIIGKKVAAKKCEAISGLIREAEEIMNSSEEGAMRDAAIISATQKIEHYEQATYGTLRTFAQTLGLDDAATILNEILEEEKNADHSLTEIAESTINIEAASEVEQDEEE